MKCECCHREKGDQPLAQLRFVEKGQILHRKTLCLECFYFRELVAALESLRITSPKHYEKFMEQLGERKK